MTSDGIAMSIPPVSRLREPGYAADAVRARPRASLPSCRSWVACSQSSSGYVALTSSSSLISPCLYAFTISGMSQCGRCDPARRSRERALDVCERRHLRRHGPSNAGTPTATAVPPQSSICRHWLRMAGLPTQSNA